MVVLRGLQRTHRTLGRGVRPLGKPAGSGPAGGEASSRPLACAIETGDPGAFVRALWGWMFAIDDELRAEQPALAQSVLSGEPVEAPTAVHLLLGATTSLRVWLRGQRDHVSVTTRLAASEGRDASIGALDTDA